MAGTPDKLVKKIIRWLWLVAILGILAIAVVFISISSSDLPTFEDLENPQIPVASTVYASDGPELGRYFIENRVPIEFKDLNPHLVNALISTEDERYYRHSGIDFKALARVLVKTVLLRQSSAGGGSTITQQLAKLLYPRPDHTGLNKIQRMVNMAKIKFKEWITAVKLERSYTKEEIIAMYLNEFEFIYDSYGIQAAAETYFGKKQEELNVSEAATLVGMLKNPWMYNPKRFNENAKQRRNVVLYQLKKHEKISEVEYDTLKVKPVDISNFKRSSHVDGLAPYFRMELGKWVKDLLNQPEYVKPDGSKYDIYRDGLNIHTTIDTRYQAHAEKATQIHMKAQQEKFFKRWEKMDPWTYGAAPWQKKIRANSLEKLKRESERYQILRNNKLGKDLVKFQEEFNFALRDVDIDRIIEDEKKKGSIKRLQADKMISASMANSYKRIKDSEIWPPFRDKWKDFQKEADKIFDTPIPMSVFTYDDDFRKDTIMSPMDSIRYHRMFLQIGSVSINPTNGHIKAWVGGINHEHFQYDHVMSLRQVGSTFKPFIYASAIAFQAISPCHEIENMQYTISPGEGNFGLLKEWAPKNSEAFDHERYNMFTGLKKSINSYSVYLMKQLGDTQPVRTLAHNMGIDTSIKRTDGEYMLPKQPSICLGAPDLRVFDMAGAYTTFANNGVYSKPIFITKIEDKHGRIIYEAYSEEVVALDEETNYIMLELMKNVVAGGRDMWKIKSEHAGKTGTTNNYTDGWFMGYTPDIVVGTWVGGEDQWIRYRTLDNGQGARMARPFFVEYMQLLEGDEELKWDINKKFKKPSKPLSIIIDCEEYIQNDGSNNSKRSNVEDDDYFEG